MTSLLRDISTAGCSTASRAPSAPFVAFSCNGRGLCPSSGAKRAALFSDMLKKQILNGVPHAQWFFSILKMLRRYFLHHRELLGDMARLAYDTVREMAAAVDKPDARPGMVGVIRRFSVHNRATVYPNDTEGLLMVGPLHATEKLARLRAFVIWDRKGRAN